MRINPKAAILSPASLNLDETAVADIPKRTKAGTVPSPNRAIMERASKIPSEEAALTAMAHGSMQGRNPVAIPRLTLPAKVLALIHLETHWAEPEPPAAQPGKGMYPKRKKPIKTNSAPPARLTQALSCPINISMFTKWAKIPAAAPRSMYELNLPK